MQRFKWRGGAVQRHILSAGRRLPCDATSERNAAWPAAWIAGALSHRLLQPGDDQVVVTLVSIVIGLLWMPGGMISVGMLSPAYRHFLRNACNPIR